MKLLFSLLFSFSLFTSPIAAAVAIEPDQTEEQASKPAARTPPPRSNIPVKANPKPAPTSSFDVTGLERPSLITQTAAIAFMSLLPFLIMMLSSFVKIVVVLSLLRSALGVQQAPPNQVINGVALLLSIYVMFPTGLKMYDAAQAQLGKREIPKEILSGESAVYIIDVAKAAREPLRDFLKNNSLVAHQKNFFKSIYRILPENYRDTLKPDDFLVLVPSFITSQLKSAFEIGVLIYIPFFVIDLVVSNILLAMGMMMLSPVTISMPLKIFLLVMLDGWTLLIQGLIATFR